MSVEIGKIYKHYKGNKYLVLNIATHTETGEKMVVYKALYGEEKIWTRPYDMFIEKVENKNQKYRFELVKGD